MDVNKIMSADILDIIFEGKNKEYGAYELRKTYNKRITIALSVMILVCLLIFLSEVLGKDDDSDKNKYLYRMCS
jgi:protein TonB